MNLRKRRPRGSSFDHAPAGVEYARRVVGLTQQQLADAVGRSKQLMCDIEAGRRNADLELLQQMAQVLNCPVVVLQAPAQPCGPAPVPDESRASV